MKTNPTFLPSLLIALFVGLKLTGIIQWSWVWVFSPIWIPLCIAILFLVAREMK